MLCHYTSQDGLLGILREDEIVLHATHFRYMNDSAEVMIALPELYQFYENYPTHDLNTQQQGAVEMIQRWWAEKRAAQTRQKAQDRALGITDYDALVESGFSEMYLCCFSEQEDQLSQWRTYGGTTPAGYDGYCLCFRNDAIEHVEGQKYLGPSMQRVQYDSSGFRDLLTRETQSYLAGDIHSGAITHGFVHYRLMSFLAALKDGSFREEREQRLVFVRSASADIDLHFKRSTYGLASYVKARIPKSALVKIWIGPGAWRGHRRAAVEDLLKARRYKDVEVRVSTSPLR